MRERYLGTIICLILVAALITPALAAMSAGAPKATPAPTPVPPKPPALQSPGSGSSPGQQVNVLTPTLQWSGVSGADYYAVSVSRGACGSGTVYSSQRVSGTSIGVPPSVLVWSATYCWTVQSHNSAGWSSAASPLYFTTATPVPLTGTGMIQTKKIKQLASVL